MPYTVYILFSPAHDRYYIGQTQDMAERINRHNQGYEKATAPFTPWIIVGTIPKATRGEAMILERKLKNLNRERLQQFIAKYCAGSGGRDDA
jgi:putative endonuclease